jgi:hypothetical protein
MANMEPSGGAPPPVDVNGPTVPLRRRDPDESIALLAVQVTQLRTALRLTREYVGYRTLPAVKGWDWYDAIEATGGFDGFGPCGCALDPQEWGRPNPSALHYCGKDAGHDGDHGFA